MFEGIVYSLINNPFFGVGIGHINPYLLYYNPDFLFWYSPILSGFTNSGINNGLLFLLMSLGIIPLLFILKVIK